jgi:bacteriocin biosynthesis cyclodehydratase domain-containing protein
MSTPQSPRLRIPNHYYVYCDPPDPDGEEALHFVSQNRRLKLKGRSFREFVQHVVPLLDGSRSTPEICEAARDWFDEPDLLECLVLLQNNGVLEDASRWALSQESQLRLQPQLNLFRDLSSEPWALQEKISTARVAVFGLTGHGIAAARSLLSAGVTTLTCIDDSRIDPADLYFSSEFSAEDAGARRCEVFGKRLNGAFSGVNYRGIVEKLDDTALEEIARGSDVIVNCLDEGQVSLAYRLNRACLKARTPWISSSHSGFEVVTGPTVYPHETACYMCCRMRMIACSADPVAGFDVESYLDRRRHDDTNRRATLVFSAVIAGQLAAIEAVKIICGLAPATRGKVQVLDLRDMSSTLHVVLRKPWCPACLANWDTPEEESPAASAAPVLVNEDAS